MDDLEQELKEAKFDKQLIKLNKRLGDKKIVIYGTGLLFKKINEIYDLANLNIIGVSDRKYTLEDEGISEFGYKVIPLCKIADYEPDYVLISTSKFLSIMDDLVQNVLKDTNIKVLPLVDKSFFKLLREIF